MSEETNIGSPRPVQRRLLVPLVLVLFLVVGGYSFALFALQQHHQDQTNRSILDKVTYSFQQGLEQQVNLLTSLEDNLLSSAEMQGAVLSNDREFLLQKYESVFASYRRHQDITHFYFHRPDEVNLLRVHQPSRYGDHIGRFTLQEARRTGEVTSGLELGRLGTFTLRVVQPITHDGEVLGYLELGKELEVLLKDLRAQNGVELITLIDKSQVERERWEEGMRMLGRVPHWDLYSHTVATYSSLPSETVRLDHAMTDLAPSNAQVAGELELAGKPWKALTFPLHDAAGTRVGQLVVMSDVSESKAAVARLVGTVSVGAVILVGLLIAFLSTILRQVDKGIGDQHRQLLSGVAEVQHHRDHLEELVNKRTEQLEATQSELMNASRLAGMTELATGVLHNVGNALTSVNISVSILKETVVNSRAKGLNEAAELMRAQGENLGSFISQDERGSRLPGYLIRLAAKIQEEHSSLLSEIECLIENVDTIKQTITVQQSFGKYSGVTETVVPSKLVSDVLRLQRVELLAHDIRLDQEYEDIEPMILERAKATQILANLVSNAIHAMRQSATAKGGHTLKVAVVRDGTTVRFSVQDSGAGIAEEHLTRIFSYGFTTKKDGHGFGLHHSANSAKELGGRLWAVSDGPGKGALFTLEVPWIGRQKEKAA